MRLACSAGVDPSAHLLLPLFHYTLDVSLGYANDTFIILCCGRITNSKPPNNRKNHNGSLKVRKSAIDNRLSCEAAKVMIRITKLSVNDQQALKVMSNAEFFSHPHTAVQLNGVLSDKGANFPTMYFSACTVRTASRPF